MSNETSYIISSGRAAASTMATVTAKMIYISFLFGRAQRPRTNSEPVRVFLLKYDQF